MLSPRLGRALALLSLLVGLLALIVPDTLFTSILGTVTGTDPHESPTKCPLGYGAADSPLLGAARVYVNCTVWGNPLADALAVGPTGRFLWVGALPHVGAAAGAEVIDLGGQLVIPGLVDAHVHLINGGLSLSRLDLRGIKSKEEFVERVCTAAGKLQPGSWLLGGNWDESGWGGEPPSASWVDDCTPHTPLFLHRMDAHMGLCNSKALSLAGITRETPDPEGGVIVRDAQGELTGLLADNAMPLAIRHIPPVSLEERRAAFRAATQHALSKGITMVHDMGRVAFHEGEEAAWEDLEQIYLPAADAGELPIRLYSFVPLPTWRRMAERVKHLGTAHQGGRLFWGGVKEFADGSLGSRTALMHEPYADDPSTSGTRTIELGMLREMVEKADAANLQVAIHAIGDRAVDDVLDTYSALPPLQQAAADAGSHGQAADAAVEGASTTEGSSSSSSGDSSSSSSSEDSSSNDQQQGGGGGGQARQPSSRIAPRRHRIEHSQHISGPGAARRMAAAGVLTTPNPLHLLADAAILRPRLGGERAGQGRAYAFKTLLEGGVTAVLASDWPVVPLDALGSIHAAVHRGPGQQQVAAADSSPGAGAAGPEALSYAEALWAHTAGGAHAAFLEEDVGEIKVGLRADFVVLSRSLDSFPSVQQTYVDGLCVYGCTGPSSEQ